MPNATNAGVSVEIDGRLYNLTVLNLTDLEWLNNEMRREYYAIVPESEKGQVFRKHLWSLEGFEWIKSTGGMPRLAYRMLRHEHPEVTVEQCYEWATKNLQPALYKSVLDIYMESIPNRGGDASAQKKSTETAESTGPSSSPGSSSTAESSPPKSAG